MPIKAIIIDDERLARNELKNYWNNFQIFLSLMKQVMWMKE